MAAFGMDEEEQILFEISIAFESIFFVAMCLKFLYEYKKIGSDRTERDISKIAKIYISGEFFPDLIPLIPLPFVLNLGGYERLFYLIKTVRMVNGF